MSDRLKHLLRPLTPPDEGNQVASALWTIAAWSWVLLIGGIIGWIKRPDLAPLWALPIGFAVATAPRWLWRKARGGRIRGKRL